MALLALAAGGTHWLLTFVSWGVPAAIPVAAGVAWWLTRSYARTPWAGIELPD